MPIIKKSGFELHPAGIYEGRLVSLEEAENLNPDWAPQFQHIFETTGTSEFGGNLTITYYTSQTLSDRSKLGGLAKALGVDLNQLQNGGDFDTDDMLDRSCNLVIEHRERDEGTKQAKVSSVSDKIPF